MFDFPMPQSAVVIFRANHSHPIFDLRPQASVIHVLATWLSLFALYSSNHHLGAYANPCLRVHVAGL